MEQRHIPTYLPVTEAYNLAAVTAPVNDQLPELQAHALREELYNELHSRPFQVVSSPAQMTHIALQHGGKYRDQELAHLRALCDRFQVTAPTENMPCYQQDFGLFELRWERHMEFSSYTIVRRGVQSGKPFDSVALDLLPKEWISLLPGKVVAAIHLQIEDARDQPEPERGEVKGYFEQLRLVGSQLAHKGAMLWTTFRIHSDGFGRVLIYNRGLSDSQMGRLSQRVLELETYRLMTSLGLPLAKGIAPRLNELDKGLKAVTAELAELDDEGGRERELLTRLSSMAAEVEAHRARSNYRFSATNAYHQLVSHRLEVLREDEVEGHLTLKEFLERRLTPAVRTCTAIASRLEDLSRRIDRASELLHTRLQLAIEEQNQELLVSMNQRSKVQLRMQQAVEGLSVAAISYYMVSLIKLLTSTLYDLGLDIPKNLITAISIPLVVGLVWYGTRRLHHHFSALDKEAAGS